MPAMVFGGMLFAILAVFGFSIASILAGSPEDPTTTWNVAPQVKTFPGDRPRACEGNGYEFFDRFQSAGNTPGTYSESFVVDGVTVTVEITVNADNTVDFDITNGVATQVWFKAAQYFLYQYDPPVAGATNAGPVSYDTGLHDGANANGIFNALSHLDACIYPVYPLTAEKTASGMYDERHSWDITKTVNPESQSGFAGDTLPWTWTVNVSETSAIANISVTGNITVSNQNPFAVPVTVTDQLDDGTAAIVNCPAASVPANGSLVCSYSASPSGVTASLNTATVTSGNPAVDGATATAGFTYAKNVIAGTATVTDTEIGLDESLTAGSGPWVFTAPDEHVCSSDQAAYGASGTYSGSEDNTATVTASNGQTASDDAATSYACYAPVLAKNASGTYDERHTWDITKTVNPESQNGFAGDDLGWTWTVTVSETSVDENFAVTGTIYVSNPAGSPGDMTVNVADVLNDATVANVDCGAGATSVTVAPGDTESCRYSASPDGKTATLNTATGTFNSIGFVATAPVSFEKNVINGTATVTDTEIGLNESLTAGSGPWVFTAPDEHVCSRDQAAYGASGTYSGSVKNIATVTASNGQSDSDDATTSYNCYAPLVSKTVGTSTFDQFREWTLTKTVDPTSQSGYPGDDLSWTWTVTADETTTTVAGSYEVSGVIRVDNPAPMAMAVTVSDKLNTGDTGTVDCGGGSATVVVPANSFALCSYDVFNADPDATSNTATATLNGIPFNSAPVPVSFIAGEIINETALLVDQQIGLNKTISADTTETYTEGVTCSSSYAEYGADGKYGATETNLATLTPSGPQAPLSASAETTWLCEAFTVELLKTTNGIQDPDRVWNFALYEGPDGFGSTAIATDSTPPALLDFGGPALRPDTTYTVCEVGVPAGWTSFWQLNGSTVIPYNPDADNVPSEDLGNRCVDFGGTVETPVAAGTVFSFAVDNSFPGGDPRTPGYWKNWNRCTGGGQAANADRNGGWAAGYWLLEDVLDPNIGGGIVWDDILTNDNFVYPITSCAQAVDILDKRVVANPAIVGDGKKAASDPLVNLATHLLAAQLNFGAGACTTQGVLNAAIDAEKLLDKYNFDGRAGLLPKNAKADAALANSLAGYLDDYNNGEFCGSTI